MFLLNNFKNKKKTTSKTASKTVDSYMLVFTVIRSLPCRNHISTRTEFQDDLCSIPINPVDCPVLALFPVWLLRYNGKNVSFGSVYIAIFWL